MCEKFQCFPKLNQTKINVLNNFTFSNEKNLKARI